jgi:chromosome segregation protein
MRVSRLEIFGFKSFMERLVLPFDGGLTGVVGPNGCGKSNIVDAVRWVLGETHARNLRGATLEDVIFNGTSELRPLGLAEVTITLRADGSSLFEDIAERLRYEESLGLETEDGSNIPASDEGDGSDSDSQLADKQSTSDTDSEHDLPRPRLQIVPNPEPEADSSQDTPSSEPVSLEEATIEAGGMLATVVNRFPWLRAVSEVQITRRLYRSGEAEFFLNQVPCRLRDIRELFRVVGMSPRSHTIVAQGEVAKIIHAKPEERRMILEEAAGVLGFRDKINAASRRLKETAENLERVEDIIREVTRQVASLKRQAQRAENREGLKNELFSLDSSVLRARISTHAAEAESLTEVIEQALQDEEKLLVELSSIESNEKELRGRLLAIDVEGDALRSQMDELRYEINTRAEALLGKKARLGEVEAFLRAGETEVKRFDERLLTLAERSNEAASLVNALEQQNTAIQALIPSEEKVDDGGLRAAETQLTAARQSMRSIDEKIRGLREELAGARGAALAYEKQIQAMSPRSAIGSPELKREFEKFLNSEKVDLIPLVDCIDVPAKLATAVQAVLRERSAYFVSSEWQKIVTWLSSCPSQLKQKLRTFGVLGEDFPSPISPTDSHGLEQLVQSVRVREPRWQPLIENLFANVFLVQDVEAAFRWFQSHSSREKGTNASAICLVTPKGELLSASGYELITESGGLIELQALYGELRASVADLEARMELEQGRKNVQEEALKLVEGAHNEELKKYEEQLAKLRSLLSERAVIRGRLSSETRSQEQIAQDVQRAQDGRRVATEKLTKLSEERDVLRADLESTDSGEDQKRHEQLRVLGEQYRKLEDRRGPDRAKLQEFAQRLAELRSQLDHARRTRDDKTFARERLILSGTHIQERFQEYYGAQVLQELIGELQNAAEQEVLEVAAVENMELEARRLRERIQREGEVDPSSIEEYQRENERLLGLQEQQVDLRDASKTLHETIARLRNMSETLFLENFRRVQQHFAELIPRLFGGGRGELVIQDESAPLDSGIEIVARPPGKKLKSIDLMSGGEKALCATALIVAMFTVRPAPLCILDEVDAPLDEANLGRFLGLVKEMSDQTQFLMITHNKASMGASDQLIGVTMEQPGASRVLQVSLQEAFKHVA